MTRALVNEITLIFGTREGIEETRRLALDMAVRGLLVEQRSDEGCAQLTSSTDAIVDAQVQRHRIPDSWVWVTLSRLGKIVGGGTPRAGEASYWADSDHGIAWLTPADLNGLVGKYVWRGRRDISPAGLQNSSAQLLPAGSVLFSSRAPIGYVAIAAANLATNQGFKSCVPGNHVTPEYLYWYLKWCAPMVDATAPGTTFREVSGAAVGKIPVALPPLREQHRIVAKVDELMALCDQLEARQKDAEAAHARLVQALLDDLSQARDADQFQACWQRLAGQFCTLFSNERSIDCLKKAVMSLAINGRLVRQAATEGDDESVVEKTSAMRSGATRLPVRAKQAISMEEAEALPAGWISVSVADVTVCRDGEREPVSQVDRDGRAKIYDYYGASGVIDKIDGFLFDKPLLLVGEDGANLINRNTPIAFIARGKYWVNNHAHVLDACSEVVLEYLTLYFNAIDLKPYVTGTAQPKLNQAKLNSIRVALPPESEQRRIVAKVTELLALCDQLKARIAAARAKHVELAEALVAQAVAA